MYILRVVGYEKDVFLDFGIWSKKVESEIEFCFAPFRILETFLFIYFFLYKILLFIFPFFTISSSISNHENASPTRVFFLRTLRQIKAKMSTL